MITITNNYAHIRIQKSIVFTLAFLQASTMYFMYIIRLHKYASQNIHQHSQNGQSVTFNSFEVSLIDHPGCL